MDSKKLENYLQLAVANSYSMYMNYKRYHWNTFGPLFRDIHLLFDEHAEALLKGVDEFGERLRVLGVEPIGSVSEVEGIATVKEAHSGMSMRDMLIQAISNHKLIINDFKKAIKLAGADNDPGTQDIFVRIIQVHEKQVWFLDEFLEKKDGLVS
jgi:starvation-inducible DNA-binding protein